MTGRRSRRPAGLARATLRTTEKPLAWPHLAFTAPHGQLPGRGRPPIPDEAVSLRERKGDSMPSEATLAWALADAVAVCFTATDRLGIYTTLGAGETYSAILRMLDIAVRNRYPLPARLISALATWLDCYVGNQHESMLRSLLRRVRPETPRTAATLPSARVTVRQGVRKG